jgi:hypothetical protein
MGRVGHGTSQWIVLGPPLQPVGQHGPARKADDPLQHDPLVAWLIKDTVHPAWNIIVVISQVFKYYDHHILLVQRFL